MNQTNLLGTRRGRFTAFGLMYISEGIPFGFTSAAMVTYLRSQGLPLDQIGIFVAALFLPWTFKWAWAPLIDLFRFNRFGGRKAWILFCTAMIVLTLSITVFLDIMADFRVLLAVMVLHNVFCATQDVAIDSLAVSTLKPDELGRGNGIMFGGQYLGIALGGAGAIFAFGLVGFNGALLMISLLMALNFLFIAVFIKDPDVEVLDDPSSVAQAFRTFFLELRIGFLGSGRGPKLGILFAILPQGALALAYATLSTMQVDFGLSANQIAQFTASNTIAAAIGCVIGGIFSDRAGLKTGLFASYVLTTIPTLVLAFAISTNGLAAVSYELFYACIVGHGFVFGMTFGIFAGLCMSLTNAAVGATQFTVFMSLSNLAISFANLWQGRVAENIGYSTVLFIDAAIVVLPLLVIPFLMPREEQPPVPVARPA